MTNENKELKEMIAEYSKLRDKIRGMNPRDRGKFTADYMAKDFKEDIAMLTGICIKLYTYLGTDYFMDTMNDIVKTISQFAKLDKYSF
jgi:hypothetical protein